MARRRIGGDGDDGDYAAFLASRQQPQSDPRMAMALQIMGLMEKQQTAEQDRAMEERKQKAQEMYQSGQLTNLAEQRKLEETKAKSEAEGREFQKTSDIQKRMDEAQKQADLVKQQTATLDYYKTKADRDAAVEVFKSAVDRGLTKADPQYWVLGEAAMPGLKEKSDAADRAIFEDKVNVGLATYQNASPKEREAFDKKPASLASLGSPDVVSEILKRSKVQTAQSGAPATPGEGRLPLSSLNAPTAPPGSDIFSEKGVRIGPPLVDARDYSKFPGSVEDLIRASGQPQPESRFAQPAPSAPSEPSNFYQEGYPSAKPDYMYGIQTPVAMDVINKYANDPRFTPVEDELAQKVKDWWNRPAAQTPQAVAQMPQTVGYGQDDAGPAWQYGTGAQPIPQTPVAVPQVPRNTVVDDLLKKALQEKQAAAQEMPWLYSNEGWPTSQPLPGPTPLPRELLQY